MAHIEDGFNGKPFTIRFENREDSEDYEPIIRFFTEHYVAETDKNTEMLHYMTLIEAISLRNELNKVIKEAAGV